MASLNRVILMGNLTKDPEVRFTPAGTAVGDLRLAVNRKFKTADGQNRDETCYVGITVWGRQAETCAEYLRKGSSVLVEGRLKYDEWEKDGQKLSRLSVVAERVQFLSGGAREAEPREPATADREENSAPEELPPREPTTADSTAKSDDDDLPF